MNPESASGRGIEAPPRPVVETIESHGCSIALSRVEGPVARELFFHCQPPAGAADAGDQAEAIYRAIKDLLEAEGAGSGLLVAETVFLRNLPANLEAVRAARHRALDGHEGRTHGPATTEIEQAPLNEQACLEVMGQAIVPCEASPRTDRIEVRSGCRCAECSRAGGSRIQVGGESRFHASGLCGTGNSAYEQTLGMFTLAEDLLQQAGMGFHDVVRTWIYLRDIDRDYGELNRARRAFFEARGVDPAPASTGIGGAPASPAHDLCLSLYAVKSGHAPVRTVMTSPTLNEALDYGADFVRGMSVTEINKVALHVSGTASIDESGATAYPGEFEAQADRMLVNIAALLAGQGASFGNVVSAITYLKRPADAARLREKLRDAGFEGFPHALVAAPICRPDLLCETEALAVLPRGVSTSDHHTQEVRSSSFHAE